MFEDYTYTKILDTMLARIPDTIDKRQGSIIYNALAPAAVELQNMYINLDIVLNETFADTASREYLIKRVSERGLTPYPATKAKVKGVFTPNTISIDIGARFSLDDLNYIVIEQYSIDETPVDGTYILECETPGADANYQIGQITPINYIEGLQTANITEILIPGADAEGTDELRQRYFDSMDKQAFGGNIADYKQKVSQLDGVGGVKVIPTWDGAGTVKLIIINSEFEVPSQTLIDNVQEAVDPTVNHGQGLGLAPIGHIVTVVGVTAVSIDITGTFTLASGYSWQDVVDDLYSVINDYFYGLNSSWADNESLIVRLAQVESKLINVQGILDISDLEINDSAANLETLSDQIVVLDSISNV